MRKTAPQQGLFFIGAFELNVYFSRSVSLIPLTVF
jgi:hypothetical protein